MPSGFVPAGMVPSLARVAGLKTTMLLAPPSEIKPVLPPGAMTMPWQRVRP